MGAVGKREMEEMKRNDQFRNEQPKRNEAGLIHGRKRSELVLIPCFKKNIKLLSFLVASLVFGLDSEKKKFQKIFTD